MTATITAATRVAGVIGDPVDHSRSPAIHNAAFAACGLDWVYVAFPVPKGKGAEAVAAMRALGIAGLNITMPHKSDAAGACDVLTPDATALGAVNTVTHHGDGTLTGDSTDGEGFLRSLADDGIDPFGRDVAVLGSGGAARAVVLALGRAGARVAVWARRAEAAGPVAALAPGGRVIELDDVTGAEIIVNATPVGMTGDVLPLPAELLHREQHVVDLIYHPEETPLLVSARRAGASVSNGLGMLVHQAALTFERWTGVPAPLDAMRKAAAN